MPGGGRRVTSFKPGQSGNPGGRPKKPELIEARKVLADVKTLAKEASETAILTLKEIMRDKKAPSAARVAAAANILDRGYGKPTQTVEANLSIFDKMSDVEQRALLGILSALDTDETTDHSGATGTAH